MPLAMRPYAGMLDLAAMQDLVRAAPLPVYWLPSTACETLVQQAGILVQSCV